MKNQSVFNFHGTKSFDICDACYKCDLKKHKKLKIATIVKRGTSKVVFGDAPLSITWQSNL